MILLDNMYRMVADGEVRKPPPPRTGTVRFSGMGKLGRGLRRRGDPGPPQHRFHQPPTGYSSAGCSPAEPPPLHRLKAILKSRGGVCQSRIKLNKNPLDTTSRFQRGATPRITPFFRWPRRTGDSRGWGGKARPSDPCGGAIARQEGARGRCGSARRATVRAYTQRRC